MNFKFDSASLLGIVKRVARSTVFQQAATQAVSSIGKEILDKLNAPEELRRLGKDLAERAPAVVGAMVKGTEVESVVDPEIIHKAEDAAGKK